MSLSAWVWTLPDERLALCEHGSLNELVKLAREMQMPMLGNVDRYDDTRFNRMQMKLVCSELHELVSQSSPGGVLDAARELLAMAELVRAKAHRYLIFVGD